MSKDDTEERRANLAEVAAYPPGKLAMCVFGACMRKGWDDAEAYIAAALDRAKEEGRGDGLREAMTKAREIQSALLNDAERHERGYLKNMALYQSEGAWMVHDAIERVLKAAEEGSADRD